MTGITGTIAQIYVELSNSMFESLFRTIKHRWLYFRSLPNVESVRQATEKFMHEYNNIIPHSALGGGTPFEVFTGKWTKKEQISLIQLNEVARENRRHANLNVRENSGHDMICLIASNGYPFHKLQKVLGGSRAKHQNVLNSLHGLAGVPLDNSTTGIADAVEPTLPLLTHE